MIFLEKTRGRFKTSEEKILTRPFATNNNVLLELFFKVIEPSEHGGAIHKPLIGPTVNCVGVNEPFYLKPPLRGRF